LQKKLSVPYKNAEKFTFYTKYKIFDQKVGYTTYLNITFLGSHDSRLYFRSHYAYFFELSIKFLDRYTTYKNFMTNKFRLWAFMSFNWTLDPIKYVYYFWAQHKILNQIKPKNIKIGKFFTLKWKRSQKVLWQLLDRICFWGKKWKQTPVIPVLQWSEG
jgi:hypothetical protein